MLKKWLFFVVAASIGFGAFAAASSQNSQAHSQVDKKQLHYIGSSTCASCHQQEYQRWQGSHHDLAMQEVHEKSVLGNFKNATLTHYGVTSRFFKREGKFFVNTPGPDGKHHDYQIAYVFGLEPLQQYLIAFPDGRYQALSIAWDSRSKEQGGQRWYHLHPDEAVPYNDSLHWTGTYYNWNSRCAECHSTDLQKNYSLEKNQYQTTWFEINVGCEGCHGPGSDHQQWAQKTATGEKFSNKGLVADIATQFSWTLQSDKKVANPKPISSAHTQSLAQSQQIETCAPCHSRRSSITHQNVATAKDANDSFLDNYQLQTLQQGLYHADGQILDEVYVYGSFIQSKMHRQGVQCSNCHDPHSLKLKAKGNNLCSQCHNAAVYDKPEHHHHRADTNGAQCVNCHMPETTYMVVDDRRDHSLRIPRPDLSEKLGTPNACNQCHQDKTPQWAASAVGSWSGKSSASPGQYHYGEALFAGRNNRENALQLLSALARDYSQPNMARATALNLLQAYPTQEAYQTAVGLLQDKNALVRTGALQTLEFLPPQQRWETFAYLLDDPVKTVRLEATRLLASVPAAQLESVQQVKLVKAISVYIEAQLVSADMPSAHLNVGIIYSNQGQFEKAKQSYLHALRLDKSNIAAMMNLADLYRTQGQDQKGIELLLQAQRVMPQNPSLHYALGLAFVRTQQKDKALPYLKQASELAAHVAHYSYTYALALDAAGKKEQALARLRAAHKRHPRDRDVLYALATMNRDLGRISKAIAYADQLAEQFPNDRAIISLQRQLKQRVP
jgi:predicted CXXCH cytochrome family protein